MRKHYITRDNLLKSFFDDANFNGTTVFDEANLYKLLDDNRIEMKTKSFTLTKFITYLLEKQFISEFEFNNTINQKKIYISLFFEKKSDYSKALELSFLLIPRAYLSYFSAMYLFNLTQQLPKKIFLSVERTSHSPVEELDQEVIDKALLREGRSPNIYLEVFGYQIFLLRSKEAKRIGIKRTILFNKDYRVSTLERTLIDIVVRSEISGGIEEVIQVYKESFKKFKKDISINKIINILKKLDYIYPYYQVVAYLLFVSGWNVEKFKKNFDFNRDFYITRGDINSNKDNLIYNKEFRIYIPKILAKVI